MKDIFAIFLGNSLRFSGIFFSKESGYFCNRCNYSSEKVKLWENTYYNSSSAKNVKPLKKGRYKVFRMTEMLVII